MANEYVYNWNLKPNDYTNIELEVTYLAGGTATANHGFIIDKTDDYNPTVGWGNWHELE